ncbi:RNA methyltransferase [Patescibacteria group bacterium]|nr:RNA methyltransferase [Patescibacteria group bacterium]MBU1015770.1 RNA methyltransferase [Patescibacteria group bacterium]MBU1685178.1 RNA methyltransferase [Patescibacteria group bacterium]MBU1938314.1 RNA methyltransferase [Patescibacteria group bacterium]
MKKKKVYVLAHNIRSLHNVGSIFRTCDGAGVSKLYLTGYSGVPPRKEITKTALGADDSVLWEFHKDPISVVKMLEKDGVQIVALEKNKNSKDIRKFKPKYPVCMIVGNEIDGVEEALLKLSDHILHIPMHGKKESLNVSVAFGIGIYLLV